MEAPRERVVEKLLHAHQSRAQRVILDFVATSTRAVDASVPASPNRAHASAPSPAARSAAAGAGVTSSTGSPISPYGDKRVLPATDDLLESVSNVRKFHHTVVAGLVEACKGFNEVFAPAEVPSSPKASARGPNTFTPRSEADKADTTEDTSTVPEDDVKKAQLSQQELQDRRKAYVQLKHTLDQIAPQYQEHFVNSIQKFFTQLNEHIQLCQELEDEYQKNPDSAIGLPGPLAKASTNPFDDEDGGNIYDEPASTGSQAELHKKIISAGKTLFLIKINLSYTYAFIFKLISIMNIFYREKEYQLHQRETHRSVAPIRHGRSSQSVAIPCASSRARLGISRHFPC